MHMNSEMEKKKIELNWSNGFPTNPKKVALLIPQFNESANCDLEKRLGYFRDLSRINQKFLDVILIDDGSTDDSFNRINKFVLQNLGCFYFASVKPNTQKVGALYIVANSISHKYVALSDFDTDLMNLKALPNTLKRLDEDPLFMGCYFKMRPFEGSGRWFTLQQFEYAFERMLYKLHNSEKSVPVMPGAGSCYRRDSLIEIYGGHSGRRNGEDREVTIIGLQAGYKTFYAKEIFALTRPPLTFKALFIQRIRWNLGYIETFYKYHKFYLRMMLDAKRIGVRTFQDCLKITVILLLPLEVLGLAILSIKATVIILSMIYLLVIQYFFYLFVFNPDERDKIENKRSWIFIYPILRLSILFFSWWKALFKFIAMKNKKKVLSGINLKPYGKKRELIQKQIQQPTLSQLNIKSNKSRVLEKTSES